MKFVDLYKPIRKNSYPLTALLITAILAYKFLWQSFSLPGLFIFFGAVATLAGLWFWQRPGRSQVSHARQVVDAIGNGRPTFLNIYSNY
ncbi:MAG: hypothetical protein ACE5HO_19925 [bacterium]